MKALSIILTIIVISTAAKAQTIDEVTTWDVLANGKEYRVSGAGYMDETDSSYMFAEQDYTETFSLNEEGSELTITRTKSTFETQIIDGQSTFVERIKRSESLYSVDINGKYLDYTGTIKGNHNIGFKSLEIVKFGNTVGLHDYNNNTMRMLFLPAVEKSDNK